MSVAATEQPVWSALETKLASVATSYTLREGMVPASAPQSMTPLLRQEHGLLGPKSVRIALISFSERPFKNQKKALQP